MSLWRDKFKNRENGSEATATPAPEAEASAAEATPVSIPTPVPTPTLGASPAAPATSSGPMPFPVFSTPLAEEPAKEPAEDPVEGPAPAPEPPAAEPAPADPDPEPTPVEPAPAATDLDFIQTVLDYRAAGCPVLKFEDHDVDFAYRVSLPSGPRYMPVEDLAKVKEADLSVVHAGYYTSETGFRPLPAADSEYYKKLWLAGHGKTSKKIW